ncbi:MAG: D-glycero-beta-D-manno-heptose-7-phosphate kinase [Flavobacteriales bacterium]|nr:D-glycero-beta-D-manno-heptose-7-phosphate kinase [Flavobacteriales bacterium]
MNTPIDIFLERAKETVVLVVGDVMLDAYLWGRVDRISPEAPVPVVHVTDRSARLGGAANVALNLRALGAIPVVVSTIGNDTAAGTLAQCFLDSALDSVGLIRSKDRTTTVKTRVISDNQHVVRVDEEMTEDLSTEEEDALIARVKEIIAHRAPAVMVLEDYNKGVLTARTIAMLIATAQNAGIPIAVDPKKKNFLAYKGVDLFKPNLKELREGLKVDVQAGDIGSVRSAVGRLEKELGNRATMVTLSEHGVYVHDPTGDHLIPAHVRKVVDVSGAGDTVIAVAALAVAQGLRMEQVAALANLAGGLVCEDVGVVPISPERLRSEALRSNLLQ